MGYFKHHAVIAELSSGARDHSSRVAALNTFRSELPDDWRHLVIGPVPAVANCYGWVVFLPDGSKEGWDTSDLGDKYRQEFLALFPGSVIVAWGDDDPSVWLDGERA